MKKKIFYNYTDNGIAKKVNRKLKYDEILAEIIGIILGDGGVYKYHKTKHLVIVNFNKNEITYLTYVKNLFEFYFNPYIFGFKEMINEYQIQNGSVFIGKFLVYAGLQIGNKIYNDVEIPSWIFEKRLLKEVIRGLFDTDGCVYRKYDNYAQIQLKFAGYKLTKSLRNAFLLLGFHPTKIQKDQPNKGNISWKFYLSRQGEIKKFFTVIKPKNSKHIRRYIMIKGGDAAI